MPQSHRIETVLPEDGKLILDKLPFQAGQKIEVIVSLIAATPETLPLNLRGMVLSYDRPTDPVAEADWSALR